MKLVVSPSPVRKGLWLWAETPEGVQALAKFRSEETAETFLDWCREHLRVEDER